MKKTSPDTTSSPSVDLPDINVWLALADTRNAHHASARRYWEELKGENTAFCRITMMGLLRVATNPKVMRGDPFKHAEAWHMYRTFLSLPEISFLPEPSDIESRFSALTSDPATAHHLWTDAYLAAFALTGGCRLVSFDADFQRFPGLSFLHLTH